MAQLFRLNEKWPYPLTPSEYVQRQFHVSFQDDPVAVACRHITGLSTIVWGNDYPHAEGHVPRQPGADREAVRRRPRRRAGRHGRRHPRRAPGLHGVVTGRRSQPRDGGRARLYGVVPVDLPRRKSLQHLVERDPPLQARERGAEAEVTAVPEREVMVDLAVDVEASPSGNLRSSRLPEAVNSSITFPSGTTRP